jgi:AcrR family transcriptional regulator
MAASAGRYRPLPSGPRKLDAAAVRRDQGERLRRALVELIAAKGYAAVRIVDIARLSRVSQPTFYSLFGTKEELLLSAYDEIVQQAAGVAIAAYEVPGTPRERMRAVLASFAAVAADRPEQISLLLLGALGAGPAALEHRKQAVDPMEQRMQAVRYRLAVAGDPPSETGHPDLTMKMIIGGVREVSASRVSRDAGGEMPGLVDELTAWADSYPLVLPPEVAAVRGRRTRALTGAAAEVAGRARRIEGRLPSGRSALDRDEVRDSQRGRIVDATAAIVAERGLAALTIPEIARRANVSNETFYEIYPSKQDAYLGAQKVGMRQALRVADAAYSRCMPDWPQAIATGLRALIDYLVSEPAHAHLSIVDTFGTSPDTILIRQQTMGAFAAYFAPGYERATADAREPAAPIAAEAVVGGCWQVLHHYVATGRLRDLAAITPQLAFLALTPFIGAEAAAEAGVVAAALR